MMRDDPADLPANTANTPVISFAIGCCVLAIAIVLVVAIVSGA
jgi:hypothetical protein